MTTISRASLAVGVLGVASLGGALYLTHERAAHPASLFSDADVASTDIAGLLRDPRSAGERLVDGAYRQVAETYYKPVDPQTLLSGERRGIVDYLRKTGVAAPRVPALHATGDADRDVAALDAGLSGAMARYGRTSPTAITEAALSGMLSSLKDPYTVYLSPAEIGSLEESLKGGDFGGIGVYIVQDARTKRIYVQPIDGAPASKAGVKPLDRIVAVDGRSVAAMSLEDVERLIRGKIGTSVRVTLRSHGAARDRTVAVVRDQIQVPSVHAKLQRGFEYVALSDFGTTSYDEVRKAFLDGRAHGAKGYILDLRNDGGGLLEAAVEISSLAIKDGPIVSTIDRAGDKDTKSAIRADFVGTAPLAILMNKFTASASEITAGAFQDDKVGELVGTRSFGKGVVQSIFNLSNGGALKITTARYVTPLGRDIQHKGIAPDIFVDQAVDEPIIDTPRDRQLAAAERYLRGAAAKGTP